MAEPKPAPMPAPAPQGAKAIAGDPALAICQDLWGHGNLSPLDDPFESRALVALTPNKKSKLAFVGRHLGRRLHRFSKESGVWIDAFESEPELSKLVKEKGDKIMLKTWENNPALMGDGKFTDVIACQPSQLDELGAVYGFIAKSLRPEGRLFIADLALETPALAGPGLFQHLQSFAEHRQALSAAGLRLGEETDLSKDIMTKIRGGFQACVDKLVELRSLEEPAKRQITLAFGSQLEIWATVALLLETGRLSARVLMASRPGV
ncbi:MAG TPA: hypothetical protein VEH07_11605 [Alphaproteobacteria bacterium]|nr:hypothetical protein [Alphaproteobacteria bacterium]